MSKFVIKDINLGGLADSRYQGSKNSISNIYGYDIHEEPGILKPNFAMVADDDKNASFYITDFIKTILPCSDGNTYLFGSTEGKVWRREPNGTYTIVYDAAPTAGAVGIMDAKEFGGYIYYSMESRLGRWQVGQWNGGGDYWASTNDDFATFTVTDPDFHPIIEQNLKLYIGDGNLLHQIDGTTFQAAPTYGLDIKAPLRIKCLGKLGNEILIGTFVEDNVGKTEIIRWNTWSNSQNGHDQIPEVGINCFISTDNYVLVSAGENGMIYSYNGTQLEAFKRIPADYSGTDKVTVHPNASYNYLGLPMFAVSNLNGEPKREAVSVNGVYSVGNANKNYPVVLNFEFFGNQPFNPKIEYGAMSCVGNNLLLSWKNNLGESAGAYEFGVDKLDLSKKMYGLVVSRILTSDRTGGDTYGKVSVAVRSIPANEDMGLDGNNNQVLQMGIAIKVNNGDWRDMPVMIDAINKTVRTENDVGTANNLQIKVYTNTNDDQTAAAEIEEISIDVN